MKKISSKIKFLLIMAICGAMLFPAIASAGEKTRVLVNGIEYSKGDYTFPDKYLKASSSFKLNDKVNKLEFVVVNGDNLGKNRLSSVKIAMLDDLGNPRAVVITPDQLNQNVGKAIGTLGKDALVDLTNITLDLKVRGPKNGFITLYVTEFYEDDVPCPWWDWSCK